MDLYTNKLYNSPHGSLLFGHVSFYLLSLDCHFMYVPVDLLYDTFLLTYSTHQCMDLVLQLSLTVLTQVVDYLRLCHRLLQNLFLLHLPLKLVKITTYSFLILVQGIHRRLYDVCYLLLVLWRQDLSLRS